MPDVTITAPVAADPIDRLTLAASDARVHGALGAPWSTEGVHSSCGVFPGWVTGVVCMAEE